MIVIFPLDDTEKFNSQSGNADKISFNFITGIHIDPSSLEWTSISDDICVSKLVVLRHNVFEATEKSQGTASDLTEAAEDQAKEQVSRKPLGLPTLKLESSIRDIDAFTGEHIEIEGYEHHPHIAAPISVWDVLEWK